MCRLCPVSTNWGLLHVCCFRVWPKSGDNLAVVFLYPRLRVCQNGVPQNGACPFVSPFIHPTNGQMASSNTHALSLPLFLFLPFKGCLHFPVAKEAHLDPQTTQNKNCSCLCFFPLVPPCSPLFPLVSPCSPLFPLVPPCSPLFPLVPPCSLVGFKGNLSLLDICFLTFPLFLLFF